MTALLYYKFFASDFNNAAILTCACPESPCTDFISPPFNFSLQVIMKCLNSRTGKIKETDKIAVIVPIYDAARNGNPSFNQQGQELLNILFLLINRF